MCTHSHAALVAVHSPPRLITLAPPIDHAECTPVAPTAARATRQRTRPHPQTYQGIDTCGDRLVEEVEALVAQNPTLRYISLLGHSMGGLLVRYAAGHLYNPSTGLMAGLRPVHYISMATPHLGCDASGESQVRKSSEAAITWRGGSSAADRLCIACAFGSRLA